MQGANGEEMLGSAFSSLGLSFKILSTHSSPWGLDYLGLGYLPNTPGKRGNPISVYILGWGHHRPPVECSSVLLAAKLWFPLPSWVQGGRGMHSIISRSFRKQPPTSTASVPPEGTVPMGHGRVDPPTGIPHKHLMPPRWPHGVPPLQPEQCRKKKRMSRDQL